MASKEYQIEARVLLVPGNRCKYTHRGVVSCHGRQFPAKGKTAEGF